MARHGPTRNVDVSGPCHLFEMAPTNFWHAPVTFGLRSHPTYRVRVICLREGLWCRN